MSDDRELGLDEASAILGISRHLVAHRMDVGDLPFTGEGIFRKARLADVLMLKEWLDLQRMALSALADDTEDLERHTAH